MVTANPANNASQTKQNHGFVVDNTNSMSPSDWYNARISNIAANGANGIVNGIHGMKADMRPAQAAYNKGFHQRKTLLCASNVVNYQLPLNRYTLFESLEDKPLPQTRVQILFDLASRNQVIWQGADDSRFAFIRMQLIVPQIIFNGDGHSMYSNNYLKSQKRTYLKETVSRSNSTQNQTGNYVINSGETKPKACICIFH